MENQVVKKLNLTDYKLGETLGTGKKIKIK
jgi:hypothetical protein